jgi:hypothetical protein
MLPDRLVTRRHVQLLYFPDCPNYQPTRELIEQTGSELGIELDLELIAIDDERSAHHLRFLGSPTVRIDGDDIEPHARDRTDVALSCRIYRTEHGTRGYPDRHLLRTALRTRDGVAR